MNLRDKVFSALKKLGKDVSYAEANKWIQRKYGKGVSDATFYTSRKAFSVLSEGVAQEMTPAEVNDDQVTVAELIKIRDLAREMGGVERLNRILSLLEQLLA